MLPLEKTSAETVTISLTCLSDITVLIFRLRAVNGGGNFGFDKSLSANVLIFLESLTVTSILHHDMFLFSNIGSVTLIQPRYKAQRIINIIVHGPISFLFKINNSRAFVFVPNTFEKV